jgi:hypothetical protein
MVQMRLGGGKAFVGKCEILTAAAAKFFSEEDAS